MMLLDLIISHTKVWNVEQINMDKSLYQQYCFLVFLIYKCEWKLQKHLAISLLNIMISKYKTVYEICFTDKLSLPFIKNPQYYNIILHLLSDGAGIIACNMILIGAQT